MSLEWNRDGVMHSESGDDDDDDDELVWERWDDDEHAIVRSTTIITNALARWQHETRWFNTAGLPELGKYVGK